MVQGSFESPDLSATEILEDVRSFLAFSMLFVLAICYIIALPIALLLNVVLRRLDLTGWWEYGLAGAVVALAISAGVLFSIGGPFGAVAGMLVFGVPGVVAGFAAACAFWWIAVRPEAHHSL